MPMVQLSSEHIPPTQVLPLTSQWLSEAVFGDGDQYFEQMRRDIRKASRTIEVAFYIFIFDGLGSSLIEELGKASQKGVKVRIIVDAIGSPAWDNETIKNLRSAGIESCVFHPLPWRMMMGRMKSVDNAIKRFFELCSKLNKRDHRKCCIIDDEIAWVGSFNAVKYHLDDGLGSPAWRDTGVRVSGPNVRVVRELFDFIWQRNLSSERRTPLKGYLTSIRKSKCLRTNATFGLRRQFAARLYADIATAKCRVWVSNAYFLPVSRLQWQLMRAAKNGVDVRLLLPGRSDVFFAPWLARAYYRLLLECGVKIYEYQSGILHAKSILFDDFAYIGSSNFNHRSLLHDIELDIVCEHRSSLNTLEQQFQIDMAQSIEVNNNKQMPGNWWERTIARVLLLLKNWM